MKEMVDLYPLVSGYYRWIEQALSTHGKKVILEVPQIFWIQTGQDALQAAHALAKARGEEDVPSVVQKVKGVDYGCFCSTNNSRGILLLKDKSDETLGEETFHDISHQILMRPESEEVERSIQEAFSIQDLAHGEQMMATYELLSQNMGRSMAVEFYGYIGRQVFQSYKKENKLPHESANFGTRDSLQGFSEILDKYGWACSSYGVVKEINQFAKGIIGNLVKPATFKFEDMLRYDDQIIWGKRLKVHPSRKGTLDTSSLQKKTDQLEQHKAQLDLVKTSLESLSEKTIKNMEGLGTMLADVHVLGYLAGYRFDSAQWPQTLLDKDLWHQYVDPIQEKARALRTLVPYTRTTARYVESALKFCKKTLKHYR